jgi:dTDP-4-amino-4,6-dideoxygalactose transaminase
MWVRTQLKIDWSDLLAGYLASFRALDRLAERARAESYFDGSSDTVATYSVRSGFDLLIQALDLKPGDEVIFSALNVRVMVRIVKELGLVPVPVDLDVAHAAPSIERLEKAITPRSKVFVAAHLFGARMDLDPVFDFARSKGLIAVEDDAQAFNGRHYPGSPVADVCMYSFGPIKTSTALGGALIRVKPSELRARMREILGTYPVQPEAQHRSRISKFMGLKIITLRPVMQMIYRYYKARGENYEDSLANKVRDVAAPASDKAPSGNANVKIRFQPSATMLWLMNRRLARFEIGEVDQRRMKGETLTKLIGDAVVLPGMANPHHDYWVYPLLVSKPKKFIEALRAEGFDAADLPRSQHIAEPADRPELKPAVAAAVMRDLIVVPCYDTMPDRELERLAAVVKKVAATVPARKEK